MFAPVLHPAVLWAAQKRHETIVSKCQPIPNHSESMVIASKRDVSG
jgi:hypothetical protein